MLKWLARAAKAEGGVRTGKRLCAIGLILALIASAIGAIYVASRPEITGWIALAAYIAITAAGLYLAQAFFELEGWYEQRGRDLEAARLWDKLKMDKPTDPFILYLRPFISTNQIAETRSGVVPIRATPSTGAPTFFAPATDRVEFEEVIEQSLRALAPLVALGQPMEHLGAGRIRVADDIWQHAIARLIDRASLIVLLPSPRPGTSWEVERILTSGALSRTLLIDPPNEAGSDDDAYDPVMEWAGVRSSFEEHGYELPHDHPDGQIVWFGDHKTPQRVDHLSLVDGQAHIRAFARKVLKSQPAHDGAFSMLRSLNA